MKQVLDEEVNGGEGEEDEKKRKVITLIIAVWAKAAQGKFHIIGW